MYMNNIVTVTAWYVGTCNLNVYTKMTASACQTSSCKAIGIWAQCVGGEHTVGTLIMHPL